MEAGLKAELADVMEGGSYYKIPKALLAKIHQHCHTVLGAFAGQNHTWQDLPEILDPLRYSDVDPQEAFETFGTLLKPFQKMEAGFYLGLEQDPSVPAHLPNKKEPWLTTSICAQCQKWDNEEGREVAGNNFGTFRPRRARNTPDYDPSKTDSK